VLDGAVKLSRGFGHGGESWHLKALPMSEELAKIRYLFGGRRFLREPMTSTMLARRMKPEDNFGCSMVFDAIKSVTRYCRRFAYPKLCLHNCG
jgi:hypothetical protein